MARLASWFDSPELERPKEVALSDAVTLAIDANGDWRGSALYIYHNEGWAIFEDMSGHFSAIAAKSWLGFAQSDDFVFAGYNDAIGYGELVVIESGDIVREFLFYADDPDGNVNIGQFDGNSVEPLETWVEAASFVDDNDLVFSEHGLLWLHGKSP